MFFAKNNKKRVATMCRHPLVCVANSAQPLAELRIGYSGCGVSTWYLLLLRLGMRGLWPLNLAVHAVLVSQRHGVFHIRDADGINSPCERCVIDGKPVQASSGCLLVHLPLTLW